MRFDMRSNTLAREAAQLLRRAGYDALAPSRPCGTVLVTGQAADAEAETVVRIVHQVDRSARRIDNPVAESATAIRVAVRDARIGRDPALVTEQGGEVLMEYTRQTLHQEGDVITLRDGTEVEVITCGETYTQEDGHQSQIVRVGTHRSPS